MIQFFCMVHLDLTINGYKCIKTMNRNKLIRKFFIEDHLQNNTIIFKNTLSSISFYNEPKTDTLYVDKSIFYVLEDLPFQQVVTYVIDDEYISFYRS